MSDDQVNVPKPMVMPRATVDQIALANAVWNYLGIRTAGEFETWLADQRNASNDQSTGEDWKR